MALMVVLRLACGCAPSHCGGRRAWRLDGGPVVILSVLKHPARLPSPSDCGCTMGRRFAPRNRPARGWDMRIPVIRGVIDRRILVNYHVDPGILATLLPPPFRPKLVHGVGMVGICLIRLKHIRPAFLPSWLGIGSENAAHRAAV